MANCYLCGCPIQRGAGFRRKVLVAQTTRVYESKRLGGSYGQTYALRTLCLECTQNHDKTNKSLAWKLPVSFTLGLVGIIGAARYATTHSSSYTTSFESWSYAFFLFGGLGFLSFILLTTFERLFDHQPKVTEDDYPTSRQADAASISPEEDRGMELLFKFILNQDGRELTTSSDLCQLVQHHAQHSSIDEAKEFIALLGRKSDESLDSWFSRVSTIAPLDLDIEDATPWLRAVYEMATVLDVDLWFGLDDVEEQKIRDEVQCKIKNSEQ